jgi:hypothetical protein
MSVDLSGVVQGLNAVSSIAVIAGVAFVVFQLRQNRKLIEVSNKQVEANLLQAKSDIALGIVERFTDDSFTTKRKTMRDIIKKYSANKWEGFEESSDDFELRAFGSYYDFVAYFAKQGIVELRTLQDVLGHRIVLDWDAFSPAAEHYREKTFKRQYIFLNWEWLAREARNYLALKEKELSRPSSTTKPFND